MQGNAVVSPPPATNGLSLPSPPDTFYVRRGKRLVDIVVASAALLTTLPIQAGVALLVRRDLGTPVLFHQERPGLFSAPFPLVKFRTMTQARGADGALLPDALRLTPLGRLLRASSLDELPELYNVVRGEMSLVGPRPLLPKYLPHYSPRESARHVVRPGITGLAQVSGRNQLSWQAKFDLDIRYVETVSLRLDLWIMLRTVSKVLRRADVNAEGHVTMPPLDAERTAWAWAGY
ncbi:MAG: sugar transferase [Actinobacteria bacterium]|nr:MAG: sugar transferase [Actinomycetota bacterium]